MPDRIASMVIPARQRELIPYVLLLIALAATAATASYAYVSGLRQDQLRFVNSADTVRAAIVTRLDAYVAMLLGGAGLFAASEDVTREEFRSYVARLDLHERYRGIQGIGFSRLVPPEDRAAVLAEMRRDLPSFEFWPDQPGSINAIVYLEPPDERNLRAFGYDMSSEPARAEAMARARDTGRPAASGKVRLVQEGSDDRDAQAGFLIYVPVYRGGSVPASLEQRRRALVGFVYSPFRADDLLREIVDARQRSTVDFDVYDGAPDPARLLHLSSDRVRERRFEIARTIEVEGRTWTIVVHGSDALRVSASRTVLALVIFAGLALSGLLFVVTRGQVKGRLAAEKTAEDLRRSEERLRQADRAKDEFLATVSHELRTPLNAIVGWTSMLTRGAVPPAMQTHAIAVISRNAAAQTRLVEDLLDMSRAVAGHLQLRMTEVDPRQVMQAAIDALRPAADEAGLILEYEAGADLCQIEADAGRLVQIVNNLLSNALKFTPRGGRVTVHADCVDDTFVLTVADTGIGMEPGFMPFVFERFRQADSSSTRTHPGAGLGLAIARHLVQLHGGSIEASSEGIGHGAKFTVRLPVRQGGG